MRRTERNKIYHKLKNDEICVGLEGYELYFELRTGVNAKNNN